MYRLVLAALPDTIGRLDIARWWTPKSTHLVDACKMSEARPTSDWRTLAADLFEKHRDEVLERLAQRNQGIDRADLHDAFVTAVLQIAAKPEKFDADQKTRLVDFLTGAAQKALLPILRSGRRRKSRDEKKAILVVNEAPAARTQLEVAADAELVENARKVAHTEEERNVLRLWELGHTDEEIATSLGKSKSDVKLLRDRLTQRLRRFGQELRDE